MENLVLYVTPQYQFYTRDLIGMAASRASRGARLQSVTIVSPDGFIWETEVLELREHVTRVEYRVDGAAPEWGDVGSASE